MYARKHLYVGAAQTINDAIVFKQISHANSQMDDKQDQIIVADYL